MLQTNINQANQRIIDELDSFIDLIANSKIGLSKEIADDCRSKSIQYCPEDTGTLMNSIETDIVEKQKDTDISIFIPESSPAAHYVEKIHDGYYNLGPKSQLKEGAGRLFIERAIEDLEPEITTQIENTFNNILKN